MTKSLAPDANAQNIDWGWASASYVAHWHEPAYHVLARYIDRGVRILEVGAGSSHTLAALSGRLDCDAFGVEPDIDGIRKVHEFAEMESTKLTIIEGSGFELPFEDETFDVVFSQGLIEHFSVDESLALLEEHRRVCRKGGKVIVSVPNLYNFPHTLKKAWLGRDYRFWPERSYSPGQLKAVVEKTGLRVTAVDGILPLWVINDHKYGWRVIAALKRLRMQDRIDNLRNPTWRARVGYMTYAVAERS